MVSVQTRKGFCTNCTLFSFPWWARPVVSYYHTELETGSPLSMRRFVRPTVYGVLEGWQAGKAYCTYCWGIFHGEAGEGFGLLWRWWSHLESIDCMEWKLRERAASLRSQDSLPWTAENPGYFSTRKAIKRHSRDTFFPFQCLRETSSSWRWSRQLCRCTAPKWRLAMRQERRRSNERVLQFPVSGPYGEQNPNPGK